MKPKFKIGQVVGLTYSTAEWRFKIVEITIESGIQGFAIWYWGKHFHAGGLIPPSQLTKVAEIELRTLSHKEVLVGKKVTRRMK